MYVIVMLVASMEIILVVRRYPNETQKEAFWSKAVSLVVCYLTLSLPNGVVLLING